MKKKTAILTVLCLLLTLVLLLPIAKPFQNNSSVNADTSATIVSGEFGALDQSSGHYTSTELTDEGMVSSWIAK